MNIYTFYLIICLFSLASCISQSTYQQSLQQQNEAMTDKERCIKNLADTKRELNKLKDEFKIFQTVSQTVLEDKTNQLIEQKNELQKLEANYQKQIAENQQNATKNCENYKNQALKYQEQDNYNQAIATKNKNIIQTLRDSVLILDLTNLNVDVHQQSVYLTAQELAFFKKENRILEKNGRTILSTLANYLRLSPDLYIYVIAHHQTAKSEDENWKIANNRAQNIALFLQSQQIESSRIFSISKIQNTQSINHIELVLSVQQKF